MAYSPLEHYGIIGNMRTAALVSAEGSIDWLCLPRFDSPSVFAAILDDSKGGRFCVCPQGEGTKSEQIYWPDTNVLISRHSTGEGTAEVIDFMPVPASRDGRTVTEIVRICRGIGGPVKMEVTCHPGFDYARASTSIERTEHGFVLSGGGQRLALSATIPLSEDDGGVRGTCSLRRTDAAAMVLRFMDEDDDEPPIELTEEHSESLLEGTLSYWRRWIRQCTYRGRWSEQIRRSALVLKLLTYEPSGAIVAAPTCSLPAPVGGERNWDYRYTWLRDAAFTLYGLMRVGFTHEANDFMQWLIERCHELEPDRMLQPLYAIDGAHEIEESVLDHLEGYRQSTPVRIGNAAYAQVQLDTPGELMDSVYLFNKHAQPVSYDLWVQLRRILDWVCENWEQKDHGVWEVRGPQRHFVYSKVMMWVALDRGVRLADKRSLPAPAERWRKTRDTIYTRIMEEGWHEGVSAFVQRFEDDALDAANLIMPLVFFVSPQDPRMLKTIDAITKPVDEGGLMDDVRLFRYRVDETDDGLSGSEAGFNICTFWLIEALTRAGRTDSARLEQARLLVEKMLASASPLGLFAEQTGSHAEQVGNFPQALTHLSFISAAFNLNRVLDGK